MLIGRGYTGTEWLLMLIGGAVIAVCAAFILYLVYHFIRALVFNISYHRWHLRVMKLNGRKPKWENFGKSFFGNWIEFLGWNPKTGVIRVGASTWSSLSKKTVYKDPVFVSTPADDSESDDLFDDDEPDNRHLDLESEIDIARRQQERNPRHVEKKDPNA